MDSLEEQLKQLTILNSRCDEGYVRTGKVAALVENLQQKVSAAHNNAHSKAALSKMAPTIPPKPFRKLIEMPQVTSQNWSTYFISLKQLIIVNTLLF